MRVGDPFEVLVVPTGAVSRKEPFARWVDILVPGIFVSMEERGVEGDITVAEEGFGCFWEADPGDAERTRWGGDAMAVVSGILDDVEAEDGASARRRDREKVWLVSIVKPREVLLRAQGLLRDVDDAVGES